MRIAHQDPALYLDLCRETSLCPYRLNTASSLRERKHLQEDWRGFFCAFFVCVCVFVCVFCRHFFGSFLTQGETKPCVTIASLFSLNSHKNQHHVQPSRVLRHGNRRATGRTHRNDGARLALLFLFFCVFSLSLSGTPRKSDLLLLLLLLRRVDEERKISSIGIVSIAFLLLRRFVYDALAHRDHLHDDY